MWNTWQLKKEFMFACFPLIYFSKPDHVAPLSALSPHSLHLPLTVEVEHWSCTKMHTAGEKPKRRWQRWKYAQGRHILLSRLDYKTARRQQQQAEPVVVGAGVKDGDGDGHRDVVGVALLPSADDVVDDMQRWGLHRNGKTHHETEETERYQDNGIAKRAGKGGQGGRDGGTAQRDIATSRRSAKLVK